MVQDIERGAGDQGAGKRTAIWGCWKHSVHPGVGSMWSSIQYVAAPRHWASLS